MMKKILAVILALCMLSALCACAGGTAAGSVKTVEAEPTPEPTPEPSPEPTPEPYDPTGGYKLTGMTGGEGSDLEIVKRVVDMGVNLFLFLEADGSGSMRFMEAEIPLSWDNSSITIPPQGRSTKEVVLPCAYSEDGSVSIRTLAYTLSFRALTDAERADYEANGSGSLGGMVGAVVQTLLGKMGGDTVESLLMSLAMGSLGPDEAAPIPDGDFTVGTVSGTVHDLAYTILGAEHRQDAGAGDVIVFYFDVTNSTDELRALWFESYEASQGGEFLECVYALDDVPETMNVNFEFVPGRTIRCAAAFEFDPAGGKVSFRLSSAYDGENTLCYYADPQALSGAPAVPFRFDDDPSIPAMFIDLPERTENVSFEAPEFFTAGDGSRAMRYFIRVPNDSEDSSDYLYHYCTAFQDGVELAGIWDDPGTVSDPENHIRAYAVRLRTDSPVIIVVTEETDSGEICVAAKVFNVE